MRAKWCANGGAEMRLGLWLCALIFWAMVPAAAQEDVPKPEVVLMQDGSQHGLETWLAGFRDRALAAGITPATLDALAGVRFLPEVVDKDRRQDEFTRAIWDYLDRAVSDDRIAFGQKAMARHKDILARIEAEYRVDAAFVVAIWGLESSYGAVRGDIPTLSALATLAYDGRRGAFFEAEMIEALRILDGGHVAHQNMLGSWAGAMGHTQFMPSSWAERAVDFDGDGKRNIWGDDPADALASTAAYLAAAGWQPGLPWGIEVTLPAGFDFQMTGKRSQKPVAAWAALGVRPVAGDLPPDTWAALLTPAGARGPAFLVTDNFTAIETYNVADAYVIAVGHLADRLRGAPALTQAWPREERVLTLEERKEMQALLTAHGFDAGGSDGKVGPLTLTALRRWQGAKGLVPDGFPTVRILEDLRLTAP